MVSFHSSKILIKTSSKRIAFNHDFCKAINYVTIKMALWCSSNRSQVKTLGFKTVISIRILKLKAQYHLTVKYLGIRYRYMKISIISI